ncbi:MAG: YiiX/YebB-like N1pC/P60 family cysteine hydrolase [Candidatus Binataceae bacterium]
MGASKLLEPFRYGREAIVRFAIRQLTASIKHYTLVYPNDLVELKRQVRKGDVILVEGNERVSEVIKYLTQSSWSHAVLYVGDEVIRRDPELRLKLAQEYGEEANYMVIEALVQSGVVVTPLATYRDFNIRICRPYQLSESDLKTVMDEAVASVGRTYDLRNIFDLGRYFLPVSLVPARFRHTALRLGSGDPTRAICSSMIAECFHKVRFPIVPKIEPMPEGYPVVQSRPRRFGRLMSKSIQLPPGLYHMISPSLVTPRDFDLSPYFEVIKFNLIAGSRFDYRKIVWADDEAEEPPKLEKAS